MNSAWLARLLLFLAGVLGAAAAAGRLLGGDGMFALGLAALMALCGVGWALVALGEQRASQARQNGQLGQAQDQAPGQAAGAWWSPQR